ncbi:MAG: hypothetical protein L0H63_11995, partial [Nitrococcus sp.]|nr:hypothetical protein [Nitrococcus sp.]
QGNDYYAQRVSYQRVCQVTHDTHYEQRVDGYDVTYRYRGETYRAQMPYDPGSRLPVRVAVTPVMDD